MPIYRVLEPQFSRLLVQEWRSCVLHTAGLLLLTVAAPVRSLLSIALEPHQGDAGVDDTVLDLSGEIERAKAPCGARREESGPQGYSDHVDGAFLQFEVEVCRGRGERPARGTASSRGRIGGGHHGRSDLPMRSSVGSVKGEKPDGGCWPVRSGGGMPLRLTLFGGLRPLSRARAMRDALAGVTLASMNIPQVLGYTRIAETPVVTGLYTVLLPLVAFATFGSSRHLVVAADSATAAIFASGLSGMAPPESAKYMALVGMVALLTAGLLLLARIFKLGFLADFLSRTVLVGFLTGVGFQVGIAMLGDMLGVATTSERTVGQLWQVMQSLGQVHLPTLALSAGVVAGILVFRHFLPQLPFPLFVGRWHHRRELCLGLCRPRHRRRRAGSGRAAPVRLSRA